MDPRDAFPLKCWLSSPGTPPLAMVHQVWLLGLRDHGGEDEEGPLPLETQSRWTLGSRPRAWGPPPAPRVGGARAAHSPSSSCPRASFAGSRLRGRRWHLASRILNRAFCLMRVAGAPGESPNPPGWRPLPWAGRWWGRGLRRECLSVRGLPGGQTHWEPWVGTSAALFLSLKKVQGWTVGSCSPQGPSSQRSVEEEGQASCPLPHHQSYSMRLALSGKGAARTREGSKEGKGICNDTDARAADSFQEQSRPLDQRIV